MAQAAKAIGNVELEALFVKSSEMLERPNTVVFNPSFVSPSLLLSSSRADLFFLSFNQAVSLNEPLVDVRRCYWWSREERRGGGQGGENLSMFIFLCLRVFYATFFSC